MTDSKLDKFLQLIQAADAAWLNACSVLPESRAKSIARTNYETAKLWLENAWDEALLDEAL